MGISESEEGETSEIAELWKYPTAEASWKSP